MVVSANAQSSKLQHAQSGVGGFFAFIAVFAPGPVEGLLQGVGSEYPEDHRLVVVEADAGNTVAYGLADVIEMGGFALYYTSQAYHGCDVVAGCQPLGAQGKFKAAGHMLYYQILVAGAMLAQYLQGPA